MKIKLNNRGSTLLEILLYLAISGLVLFAIMSFAMQIMGANKKASTLQEIQASMDFVSNKLSSTIQIAEDIDENNSILENDNGKLSLIMPDPALSPTSIYLENNNIYVKEGLENASKINSDFVKCTQLRFEEVTVIKAPKQVILDLQCEPRNNDLAVLKDSLTLHTAISLRK